MALVEALVRRFHIGVNTLRQKVHSRARGEEAQLSSGWISIGLELSSLNFKSSVRVEQSFAIYNPNVVIKSLCGNLDICLNYYDTPTFGRGILFA